MVDKFFLSILVLFTMVGIFAYDQYLTEKGEVGPVSQLIDYAGLSEFNDWRSSVIKKTTRSTYNYNLQNNLSRLQERYRKIEEQRMTLIQNRNDILQRLGSINTTIENEAQEYAAVITQEQNDFLDRFPEIKQMGQDLLLAKQLADPVLREQTYQQLESQLLVLFRKLVDQPNADVPRFIQILEEMAGIFGTEVDIFIEGCDDFDQCFPARIEDVDTDLIQMFEQIVQQPGKDLDALAQSTQILFQEFQILSDNLNSSEGRLDQTTQTIASEFKALTSEFVKITQEDFEALMDDYQKLQDEQQIVLENLELNRQRFLMTQQMVHQRIREITDNLEAVSMTDTAAFMNSYENLNREYHLSMKNFKSNENHMRQIINARWRESDMFINKISGKIKFNYKKLMNERKFAEKQNQQILESRWADIKQFRENQQTSRANDHRARSRTIEPQAAERNGLEMLKNNRLRSQQHNPVKEQMQRLRDRTKDQGF